MNADDIANLRSRGARLGDANAHQWRELVTAYSLERVRYAVVSCKVAGNRDHVTVEEAAKKLGHKLRAGPSEPVPEPQEKQVETAALAHKPKPVQKVVQPPEPTPVLRAKDELERLKKAEAKTTKPAGTSIEIYTATLTAFPGITQSEIAARVRKHVTTISGWLSCHPHLVDHDGGGQGKPRRYWLKGQMPPAPAPVEGSPGERSAPISDQHPPADEPKAPDREPIPPPAETSSPVAEPPPPWTTGDGESFPKPGQVVRLPQDQRISTALAFTVTDEEMGGDLRVIMDRLLGCYADRHGFAHAYRQTAIAFRTLTQETA